MKGKIFIHGHTVLSREVILSQKFKSPYNLDGGCVFKKRLDAGILFALNFYERQLIEVINID
ncbi:MAG: hypothetical protein WBB02_03940 [Saprospiraceae bacterium]